MEEESLNFLERLINTPSPSGYEGENLQKWIDYVEGYADKVETDPYGNTVATLNPGAETSVMVTGHADEIGFMVNHISEEGYIYLEKIGGIDVGVAQGQRVVIQGRDGPVKGVIGRKPIHLQEEEDRKNQPEMSDLYIDVGAEDKEEVEDLGVEVGSIATYDVGFDELNGDVVAGRGLDNRMGIWIAAETLRVVSESDIDVTLHAVATVQEEVGLRGAFMVGHDLDPDIALVVDVTHSTDIPDLSSSEHGEVELGQGPVFKRGRENHPGLIDRLREVGEENEIDLQFETMSNRGGTDADAFYRARGATPTISLGVPNRYMHTTVELIDLNDLEGARDLFAGFVEDLEDGEEFGPDFDI